MHICARASMHAKTCIDTYIYIYIHIYIYICWPLTCDFYFVSLVTSQALPERQLTCDFYFGSLVTSLTREFAARLGKSASNHL